MSEFDFDRLIPRAGTHCVKYDGREAFFGTVDVLPMWVADMDFAAPPAVIAAIEARAQHPVYGYTHQPEIAREALQTWLEERHGWKVKRASIVLCPGVVPSLYACIQALTEPGDKVIVQPPVYPPFMSAINDNGRKVVENPLRLNGMRYEMDFEHLEQCAQGAKMLLLCSPHNPVGRVWTQEELERVLDIARRHKLIVIADEIHGDLVFAPAKHLPLAMLAQDGDRIITAVAPSKTFNVAGLEMSALVCPDELMRDAIRRPFDKLHIKATNPFSIAAFDAAYREGAAWLDALLDYLVGTSIYVQDFCERYLPGIHVLPSEGTCLLWIDCRELGATDEELKEFFVKEAKVGMSPGISFGTGGSGFMRMNIGASRKLVAKGLERIHAALMDRLLAPDEEQAPDAPPPAQS